MGKTAYTTEVPRCTVGTQARACAAFVERLRWVRVAPLGRPVVPLVYWMTATSAAPGRTMCPSTGEFSRSFSQVTVPRTGVVSAEREARARPIGSRSSVRVVKGMALVTSTDTTVSTATSSGSACTVATTLFQTMANFAPWSSNWWRSSRGVYSGLCSTTIAPRRSTA